MDFILCANDFAYAPVASENSIIF